MRTVSTNEECRDCGASILHHEMGYAVTESESFTWLVASRFCSVGCALDERRPQNSDSGERTNR